MWKNITENFIFNSQLSIMIQELGKRPKKEIQVLKNAMYKTSILKYAEQWRKKKNV